MSHVDIIGAGVAGLSLGIYLQKKGIDTHIYEQHSMAGGLCTSWQRGAYTFNGCLHWVLGAKSGTSFYTMWKELFDIDQLDFFMPRERVVFDMPIPDKNGCKQFHFYTNIDEFEHYLLDIAPEDETEIRLWCSNVRLVMSMLNYLPPIWPRKWWHKALMSLKLIKLLKILPFMHSWGKMSNRDYAKRFKNSFLQTAIMRLYDAEMRMTVVVFAQAYAAQNVAQYPIGGSAFFIQQLVDKYKQLGGQLHLHCKVNNVLIADNQAVGLQLANGEQTKAQYVVSAADWHWTIFDALRGQYLNRAMMQLKHPHKNEVFYSYCRLFIGVAMPMDDVPHFARIDTEPLTMPDGTRYDHLEVETYNNDPTLAPLGHVTMAVNLLTREGEWWIDLRQNNRTDYRNAKRRLENEILQRLEIRYGSLWRSKVEQTDMVTPATWYRYTNNMWGSSQGWTPRNDITQRIAVRSTLPHLKHFALCGHWTEAGGGIPVALYSARKVSEIVAKQLCDDTRY